MNKKQQIIPAIIASNQRELDERLDKVIDLVETVQLDVMDNQFVPNNSLWFEYTLPSVDIVFEAHLMVKKPIPWIKSHIEDVDIFLVHHECEDNINDAIELVRDAERSIGLVINPDTPVEKLKPFIHEIDQVLVMTVKPGFYGSPFLPKTLEKIKWLKNRYPDVDLEVDGGITVDTIFQAAEAGANKFVSGSFIVKASKPDKAIQQLQKAAGIKH